MGHGHCCFEGALSTLLATDRLFTLSCGGNKAHLPGLLRAARRDGERTLRQLDDATTIVACGFS